MNNKLRILEDGLVMFWCPGCECAHVLRVGSSTHPKWGYNGNPERPTFTPSIVIKSGHYIDFFKVGDNCWCTFNKKAREKGEKEVRFKCTRCHSFVTDGRIQFLADCTHALAGQTVDLPNFK